MGPPLPSDAKDSQVFADIPNAVAFGFFGVDPITVRPTYDSISLQDAARRPQRRQQKSAPALGEKLGPGAAKIAEQRVCILLEVTDKRWGVLTVV